MISYRYCTFCGISSAGSDADLIKVTCLARDRNHKTGTVTKLRQILDLSGSPVTLTGVKHRESGLAAAESGAEEGPGVHGSSFGLFCINHSIESG